MAFQIGKRRVHALVAFDNRKLSSLPVFYGWCALIWGIGLLVVFAAAFAFYSSSVQSEIQSGLVNFALGALAALVVTFALVKKVITPQFHARYHIEKIARHVLFTSSFISVTITIMIVASVLFESIRFFQYVSVPDFLFGTKWSPQTATLSTEGNLADSFGAVPIFVGTLMITFIAMVVAVPLGLMSAIYLSEFASKKIRSMVKPVLEILAGIPTVVYGYFAIITVAPFVRDLGINLGMDISTESALVAGSVMGIMIIPFILSLSDDAMHAVPNSLRDASLALGGTKAETVMKVVVPSALPGIAGAVLLAISRAIGETMIVVMAAGLSANLTANPLESVTTVTTQIVTLLVGDQEFDSPKTLVAFALGLALFIVTLILNVISLYIVRKYREQYE
ncbi:MAG: phosphate ABC transporter permease subunit PstC [Rickettsiales bacterium]|nr:phosphate ABC transporter permease subunit PstC [Rickettsiales bacterium]